MSQQLSFRLAERTERDAGRFCRLSNSLYARPVNEAYYDWQMFRCPFPSFPNVAVDREDNIVGSYCLHVQDTHPRAAVKVAWVLDIMVSPEVQRQGVFRKMVDFGFENIRPLRPAAIVVMANEKAERACVQGLGWKLINTFLTCFANPGDSHGGKKFILEYERINDFSKCRELLPAGAAAAGPNLFANARTAAYQNWRFIENPRYGYDVFLAHKKGAPFGCLVLKTFRDPVSGESFGDIVDILWAENDREALSDMLRFSLFHFHRRNVGACAVWLQTNTLLDEVGEGAGFRQSGQRRFFCGKALDAEYGSLENADAWFINMSDSEVY